jgi:hypothetical protein
VRVTSNQRKTSGFCLLILAAIFAAISLDAPPSRANLQALEGRVEEVVPATSGKNGLPTRFRLSGDARLLQYHSKSGDMGRVEQELRRSAQEPVRVLVDSADRFSTVYEVIVGGRTVRSYDDVTTAWRRDNQLGLWIACASAVVGALVLMRARWK